MNFVKKYLNQRKENMKRWEFLRSPSPVKFGNVFYDGESYHYVYDHPDRVMDYATTVVWREHKGNFIPDHKRLIRVEELMKMAIVQDEGEYFLEIHLSSKKVVIRESNSLGDFMDFVSRVFLAINNKEEATLSCSDYNEAIITSVSNIEIKYTLKEIPI